MKDLYFAEEFIEPIIRGDKLITLRDYDPAKHSFRLGDIVRAVSYDSHDEISLLLEITEDTVIMPLTEVSDSVCQEDGFDNQQDMFEGMKKFYPDLELTSTIGIVRFRIATINGVPVVSLRELD